MRFPEQEHAESGLTDTTPYRLGEFSGKKPLVELQCLPFQSVPEGQLAKHGFLVDADTHGRYFKCSFQNRIPKQDVSIESLESFCVFAAPVIVVRSPTVVYFSIRQGCSDTDDEYGAVFPGSFRKP